MRPYYLSNHCPDLRSILPIWPMILSICQRCCCKLLLLALVCSHFLFFFFFLIFTTQNAISIEYLLNIVVVVVRLHSDLQSNYFLENHSHMLSGNHDNETTLRLLYYPPVIQEDDNKCELTKGRCKYSQQRCNGNGGIDLIPRRDVVKTEKSRRNSASDTDDETDDTADENNGNVSDHSKSSKSSSSSSIGKHEFNVTRCGAHCK